jgi:hypothetical protein
MQWVNKRSIKKHNVDQLKAGHVPDGRNAFIEAITGEDRKMWIAAIVDEMTSLEYKQVMRAMRRSDLPNGRKPIKARWVFAIKKNSDGTVERFKARLVAKGFLQKAGQDYTETFAPTPSFSSIRLLTAVALQHGWSVTHMDVKTAFLEGELEWWERVYLEAPPGYNLDEDEVFALQKCLYGLKQAGRKWNKKIFHRLKMLGLQQSTADSCVWVKYEQGNLTAAIAVHVDDILITGRQTEVLKIKTGLQKAFTMKDLGQLSWYLGVRFTWTRNNVYLSQEAYTKDVLERHRMSDCNPRKTPAVPKSKLTKPKEPITAEEQEWLNQSGKTTTEYNSIVGAIRYLADRTRPDITEAVGQLARHLRDPRREHWVAVKTLLGYLKNTQKFGLRFSKESSPKVKSSKNCQIMGYSDSDWAGDPDDYSSTSGYVFMYCGGAISWASKKQQDNIARSSAEAEIIALDLASREGLWLRKLKSDFCIPGNPTVIREDNQAAIAISEKHARTQRTKHFNVKYSAIRHDIGKDRFSVEPVASADNVADAFTKSLGRVKLQEFRTAMGIVEVPTEGER